MDEALTRRVPPHSEEAERSVIGSMVMSGEAAMAAEEMLTGDDFYDRQLGAVFETMKALSDARKPIDLITLKEALEKQNLPEDVKNMEFMKEILASLPTSANVRKYAEIVRDKATLRRLISAASEVEQDCYRQQKETQEILDDAEKTMFQVLQQRSTESYVPVKDVVYNALEAISTRERTYLWYRFGFPDEPQNRTIKDTASHFHLSESRAKSTEAAALDNIRLELPWWYD